MTKLTRLEVNCETGQQTVHELTNKELAQMEIDRVNAESDRATRKAEEDAKTARRASAITKLKALGLTEDEVTALI